MNWSDPANWDPDGVPTADNDVVIAQPGTYTVRLDQNAEVSSLTLGCAGADCTGTQTVRNEDWTGHLTINAASHIRPAGTVEWMANQKDLHLRADLTVEGVLEFGGSRSEVRGSGVLHIQPGGVMELRGSDSDELNTRLENEGHIAWSSGGWFGGGVLHNQAGGTFTVAVDESSEYLSLDRLNNEGIIVKTSSSTTDFRLPVQNDGTLDVQAGTITLNPGDNYPDLRGRGGIFRASDGGTLHVVVPSDYAEFDLDSASQFEGEGTVYVDGLYGVPNYDLRGGYDDTLRVDATWNVADTLRFSGGFTTELRGPLQKLGDVFLIDNPGSDEAPHVLVTGTASTPLTAETIKLNPGGTSGLPLLRSDVDINVDDLILSGGTTLGGNGTVTVHNVLQARGGFLLSAMRGAGTTRLATGAAMNITGEHHLGAGRTLDVEDGATVYWKSGDIVMDYSAWGVPDGNPAIHNAGRFRIETESDATNEAMISCTGLSSCANQFEIVNTGTVEKTKSTTTIIQVAFTNRGALQMTSGAELWFDANAGEPLLVNEAEGTIRIPDGSVLQTGDTLQVKGGALRGSGFVTGDVANTGGTVQPGSAPGTPGYLVIEGTYRQGANGTLDIEIAGTGAGTEYDRLDANSVALGGALNLTALDGFTPSSDDIFLPLRWDDGARTGTFQSVNGQETEGAFLALKYMTGQLEIYDGSLSEPPPPPLEVSVSAEAPPFVRQGRNVSVDFEVQNPEDETAIMPIRIEGVSVDPGDGFAPCPTDDAYANLTCRMNRYGDETLPPPPEGESYPFLPHVPFPPSMGGGGSGDDGTSLTAMVGGGNDLSTSGSKKCEGGVRGAIQAGSPFSTDALPQCAYNVAQLVLSTTPGYDCFKLAAGITTSIGEGFHAGQFDLSGYLASNMVGAIECAGDAVPATKAIKIMRKLNDIAGQIQSGQSVVEGCSQVVNGNGTGDKEGASTSCVSSLDPNDKVGPPGLRTARYIAPGDSLPYVVFFENKASATAPAQVVTITDTLDTSEFDAAAFRFGPVAFGDTTIFIDTEQQQFVRDVDLRPERDLILRIEGELNTSTGLLTWTFTSLDPATMQLTTDPLAGFLPPNDQSPEGEGLVSYYAGTASGVMSGTEVGSAARIVFDQNAPIDTPVWTNTIDAAPPSTAIEPLAAEQDNVEFEVRWGGSDAESGLRDVTVYVSKDGGPFAPWLEHTTATAATYTGERGSEYAFYSVARDSVGHRESKPSSPDATTVVANDALPVELAFFEAKMDGETVRLTWRTASETNNAGFRVERKRGATSAWTKVGFVEGAGTTAEPQTYAFGDADYPYEAETLTYRLKQVDTDGTFEYSPEIEVGLGTPDRLVLHGNFPNPFQNQTTIRYELPVTGDVRVGVYDVMGRQVAVLVDEQQRAGRKEITFDASKLTSGVYFVRLSANGHVRTQRLTVVR